MASVGENLRTYLTTNATITAALPNASTVGAIQQNKTDENGPARRIWFRRSSREQEVFLDGCKGPEINFFDVECISDDIDEAIDLADAIKSEMNGYSGSFGAGYAQAIFVEDHSDDYLIKGIAADSGLHVAAIELKIITAA